MASYSFRPRSFDIPGTATRMTPPVIRVSAFVGIAINAAAFYYGATPR